MTLHDFERASDEWADADRPEAADGPGEATESRRDRWLAALRRRWRLVLAGVAAVPLLLIAVLLITAPLSKSLQPITAPSLTLLSAEGVPIARRGAVVERRVDAAELPAHVVQPFLAIEDRRFYRHMGLDLRGVGRAVLSNLRAGGVVEGGSTITQQLAKLAFLSPERTAWRKLQEMVLALWLEARLSKDEILSRYLSSVYFGDNVYGLRAAARHYFSSEPEELTLEQAAMLAGLVKAPSVLAPTRDLDAARERARVVLDAMIAAGMLTSEEAERVPQAQLRIGEVKDLPSGSYFADWVFPLAEARLKGHHSRHEVVTTLEDRLQREAVAAIRAAGIGNVQVALVAMRHDGSVVAMVGGKSYRDSPFNRATQAQRQPGSTFKLFTYLAALREGQTPDSPILDAPLRIGNWAPDNYGQQYRGQVTLREAFAVSSNVAAVRLAETVGREKVIAAARDLGLSGELEEGPTMTLGTSAVPLIEMVAAYAGVAAGRYPVRPHGLPMRDEALAGTERMPANVRAGMLDLLRAVVVQGSGRGAALPVQSFGKTGTSQGGRDAYFIGFAGDLVTGVWIGHDDNRPIEGLAGGGLPAQIWRAFMERAATGGAPAAPPAPLPTPRELPGATEGEAEPFVMEEYDVGEAEPVPLDGLVVDSEEPPAGPDRTPPPPQPGMPAPPPRAPVIQNLPAPAPAAAPPEAGGEEGD